MRIIKKICLKLDKILIKPFIWLLFLYQKTISPDHAFGKIIKPSLGCRFYPSCSMYSYQALQKYNFFKGMMLSFKRLIRCHPWQKGGCDPLV